MPTPAQPSGPSRPTNVPPRPAVPTVARPAGSLPVVARPAVVVAAEPAEVIQNKLDVITAALPPGSTSQQISLEQLPQKLFEAFDLITLRDQSGKELGAAEKREIIANPNYWKTPEIKDAVVGALKRHYEKLATKTAE